MTFYKQMFKEILKGGQLCKQEVPVQEGLLWQRVPVQGRQDRRLGNQSFWRGELYQKSYSRKEHTSQYKHLGTIHILYACICPQVEMTIEADSKFWVYPQGSDLFPTL